MKRLSIISLIVIAILALSMTLLPVQQTLARKSATVTVTIRNRTEGTVHLTFFDEKGITSTYAYEPGVFKLTIAENNYQYHASTPCGNQAGSLNLNVSKVLFLSCQEAPSIELVKPSNDQPSNDQPSNNQYCYPAYDWIVGTDGLNSSEWHQFTTHCQDHPATSNELATIYNPEWDFPFDYYYQPDLKVCDPPLDFGEGYAYECKK